MTFAKTADGITAFHAPDPVSWLGGPVTVDWLRSHESESLAEIGAFLCPAMVAITSGRGRPARLNRCAGRPSEHTLRLLCAPSHTGGFESGRGRTLVLWSLGRPCREAAPLACGCVHRPIPKFTADQWESALHAAKPGGLPPRRCPAHNKFWPAGPDRLTPTAIATWSAPSDGGGDGGQRVISIAVTSSSRNGRRPSPPLTRRLERGLHSGKRGQPRAVVTPNAPARSSPRDH